MTTPPTPPAPATAEPVPTAEVAVQHHLHFTLTFTEGGRITGGLAEIAVATMQTYARASLVALLPKFANSRWTLESTRSTS